MSLQDGSPKKPLLEQITKAIRLSKWLNRHPFFARLFSNNLFWGTIFAVLIVALLVELEGLEKQSYQLNSVVNETIIASQDMRIPDISSTENKRRERLENLKTIYIFDDTQWNSYIQQIGTLFRVGREMVQARLSSPFQSEIVTSTDNLARNIEFLRSLRSSLTSAANLTVPEEVLSYLVTNNFSSEIENSLSSLVTETLQKPIVNRTLNPPLASGHILQPIEDESKSEIPLVGLTEARNRVRAKCIELFGNNADSELISSWLITIIEPNVTVDTEEMRRLHQEALNVETLYFDVKRGEVIARKGDKISDDDHLAKVNFILESRYKGLNLVFRIISLSFFTGLFLYTLNRFSNWHKRRRKVNFPLFLLLLLALALNIGFIRLSVMISDSFAGQLLTNPIDYYWAIPFAIGSMLITLLVGTEIAALYSIILVFLSGFLFNGNFSILIYSLIGGFVSIYGLRKYKERTALIKSGIALGLMNIITIIAINLLNDNLQPFGDIVFSLIMGFVGGIIVSIIASFLLPIFESLFKIVTDIKLLELSNHEHPLLRSLFLNAPGTFQHSIVVGYLAEAAANEINANALFCRVSCLYHDVGKMVKSKYYVENSDDLGKRHDKLSPHMSALIISNHVKEGMEMAREFGLPESIIDIIPQHHGTRLIKYFYEKAKSSQKPDDVPVKEEEFRYPGPKPQTREAGIIMIADSVEAAARSLDDPSPARLKGTIKSLIDHTFLDGQLDECDLTLKDLTKIADAFLKVLLSMKHERVKYPGFPHQEKRKNNKSQNRPEKSRKETEKKSAEVVNGDSEDTVRRSQRQITSFEESGFLEEGKDDSEA